VNHSIVCAIDSSPESQAAARVAAKLARELDHKLVLTHVADDPPTFPYRDARLRELQRRDAVEAATAMLESVAAALPGIAPELRVLLGPTVDVLTAVCREERAELLVVGSRGRGPLKAAALGSVSAELVASASVPVLVVPPAAEGNDLAPETATATSSAPDGDIPRSATAAPTLVGRFSTGIERLRDTTQSQRPGRFSTGIETWPPTAGELRRGRYSDGIAQLPETAASRRRGSFADGHLRRSER
jgi:nucleotide-binding universal stress UspA family protein